jgi:general stress protein YciG
MSGNRTGGLTTVAILKARDPDHYKKIGSMGGAYSGPDYQVGGKKASGFAAMTPEQRAAYGAKGGAISRRTKAPKKPKRLSEMEQYEAKYGETSSQPNPAML